MLVLPLVLVPSLFLVVLSLLCLLLATVNDDLSVPVHFADFPILGAHQHTVEIVRDAAPLLPLFGSRSEGHIGGGLVD
jgi:hypothetical protein